jgi:hypothetical protein
MVKTCFYHVFRQGNDRMIDFILPKNSKKLSKKNVVAGSKTKFKKQLMKPFFIAAILVFLFVFEVFSSTLSVEDFVAEATLFDVALSPNGKYLAEIIQQGKVRHVRVKDISLPDWSTIGNIGDNILRANGLVWVNDNRLLVSLVVPGKTKEARENLEEEEDEDFDIYQHGYITKLIVIKQLKKTPTFKK